MGILPFSNGFVVDTFGDFFDDDGEVDERILIQFFWGLKLETKAANLQVNEEQHDQKSVSNTETFEESVEPSINESSTTDDIINVKEPVQEELFDDEEEEFPEATSIDDFFK